LVIGKEDLELYPEETQDPIQMKENIPTAPKDEAAMDVEAVESAEDRTEVFMTIELGNGNLLQLIVLDELD
jgi:hypothetical protein